MGSLKYPKSFAPLTIRGVEFRNRFICTPNVCGWGSRGILTQEQAAYYERIASSGVAVVNIGNCAINMSETSDEVHQLDMSKDEVIFGLSNLRKRVMRYNSLLSAQINYCGRNGWYAGSKHYAPSALPSPGALEREDVFGIRPQEVYELSHDKIYELIDLYAAAAGRLKRAGFKILQVHCAHNNLIGQFFSPISNFRTDQYGIRSLEDRTRFGRQVLAAVRKAVGEKVVIDIRFSGEDVMPGGLQQDEAVEIGKILEPYVDLMTISCAFHAHPTYIEDKHTLSYLQPQLTLEEYTKPFRKAIKNAKLAFTTNVVNVDNAEHILEEGIADFVGMFRPFLADPQILIKSARDESEKVNQCIRCEYHMMAFMDFQPIACAVNPFCGRELEYPEGVVPKAPVTKKVLVVGAGPAGLQAALTATERGHQVTLVEKEDKLGGNLLKAAALPLKAEFKKFVNYLIPRVEACGAKIVKNTTVDAAFVKTEKPDVLIIAVGTEDVVPPIPGVDKKHVHFCWEADQNLVPVGEKVLIIGAGLVGMESSLQMSRDGKQVTVVEMQTESQATAGKGLFGVPLVKMNAEAGTAVLYQSHVTEIGENVVTVKNAAGEISNIEADTVLLAAGVRPRSAVVEELRHTIGEGDVYLVGDLSEGGTIGWAVNSGFDIAAHI